MLQLRIANSCRPTGRVLTDLLRERGVRFHQTDDGRNVGVVCWGIGYTGEHPSLNKHAGRFDKYEQLVQLNHAGVRVVPTSRIVQPDQDWYPAFARTLRHMGGTDIRLALQPEDAALILQRRGGFLTKYVPSVTEFRVWVYRRRHLGTYQKILAHPDVWMARARFGRNHDSGFAFRLVNAENIPRAAVELAVDSVGALSLDFGAVDILQGKDTRFYVLEVNTAPGVEGENRQVIQGLADKIARWEQLQYPRRNGDQR